MGKTMNLKTMKKKRRTLSYWEKKMVKMKMTKMMEWILVSNKWIPK